MQGSHERRISSVQQSGYSYITRPTACAVCSVFDVPPPREVLLLLENDIHPKQLSRQPSTHFTSFMVRASVHPANISHETLKKQQFGGERIQCSNRFRMFSWYFWVVTNNNSRFIVGGGGRVHFDINFKRTLFMGLLG